VVIDIQVIVAQAKYPHDCSYVSLSKVSMPNVSYRVEGIS